MKKIALLTIVFFTGTGALIAQENIKKRIDNQYVNESHKAFLYQVSPNFRTADNWVLEFEESAAKAIFLEMEAVSNLPADTSWGYTEYKNLMDSMFIPQTFSRRFYEGDSSNYTYLNNQHVWQPDSTKWKPQRIQKSYFSEDHGDSSITFFYNPPYNEPYTGQRSITPKNPAEGATAEQYWDYYNPEDGWVIGTRNLSYRDDQGLDTLQISYDYNIELMDYQLTSLQRRKNAENYYYTYNEGYFNGNLSSTDLQENTTEYELRDRANFNSEGTQTSGRYDYTKLGEGGRYIYQVSKNYNSETMQYQGADSLHFIYAADESYTEAEGFYWNNSDWELDEAYTSYQSEHATGELVVDSIVVFEISTNEETMERERGRTSIRTEMDYDVNGNQIEVRNYTLISDTLKLNSKTVRTFREFLDFNENPYFVQSKQENYSRDFLTGEIYFSSMNETFYSETGAYTGAKNFSFNAAGDTTYGYQTQRELLLDGSTIEVRYDWDLTQKKMILKSYRITNRRISGSAGQSFTQTMNKSFVGDQESVNRSMSVYTNYPGIFNDGPIVISRGDTVSLFVSAFSPDMTVPKIEVTNMPASATFDPETRHFYWIVDDENPSPMMYKAIRGETHVSTEVEFVNEQFAVGTEEEENPNEFRLSQNYPNPFNPTTNITFNLPASGEASLKVYNLLGQEVATLVDDRLSSGAHAVTFDASKLASGMYIYRLQAGSYLQTKKMLLIK